MKERLCYYLERYPIDDGYLSFQHFYPFHQTSSCSYNARYRKVYLYITYFSHFKTIRANQISILFYVNLCDARYRSLAVPSWENYYTTFGGSEKPVGTGFLSSAQMLINNNFENQLDKFETQIT